MFASCKALSSLDVSHFNTANVTSMKLMFYLCSILTTLDLSNFNIGKVTNISNMFYYCRKLQTIYCDDDWSASTALTDATGVFVNCDALVGGNGTAYNNSNPSDKTYARPDEGTSTPGYFTKKTATALDQVPSTQGQSTKFLRDGNLFILRGDKTYTITGQAVK
jgi:surface protein